MRKRLLSLLLAASMLFSLLTIGAGAAEGTFSDDDGTGIWSWAGEYIYDCAEAGIISGYEDGTYLPDNYLSRAEAAKIIAVTFGLASDAAASTFSDVADSHWALTYIEACAEAGIINGYEDGRFLPDNNVTRAEMAKLIACALGLTSDAAESSFTDVGTHWALQYIEACVDAGIINGMGDGTFEPSSNITRAQAAAILSRTLDVIEEETSSSEGSDTGEAGTEDLSDSDADSAGSSGTGSAGAAGKPDAGSAGNPETDSAGDAGEPDADNTDETGETDADDTGGSESDDTGDADDTGETGESDTNETDETGGTEDTGNTETDDSASEDAFYAKDIEDFDGYEIINFDEDETTNYAVLSDDAQTVTDNGSENTLVSADDDTMTYTITNLTEEITDLEVGDILYYVYGDGTEDYVLMKVGSISISDGAATITAAEDTEISDLFLYVDVDMEVEVTEDNFTPEEEDGLTYVGAAYTTTTEYETVNEALLSSPLTATDETDETVIVSLRNPTLLASVDADETLILTYTLNFPNEGEDDEESEDDESGSAAISGSLSVALAVRVKIVYDKELYGEDYLEILATVSPSISASVEAACEKTWSKTFKLGTVTVPIGVTGLAAYAGLALDMKLGLEGTVTLDASVSGEIGLEYDSVEGLSPIAEGDADLELSVEATVTAYIGLTVTPGITWMKIASLEVDGSIGEEVTGTLDKTILETDADSEPEEKHTCAICIDGEVNLIASVSGKVKILTYTYTLSSDEPFSWHQLDFYVSLLNEDSEPEFGIGSCPHIYYRTIVTVTDYKTGEPVSGVEITVDGEIQEEQTDSEGRAVLYFGDGSHTMTLTHEDYYDETDTFLIDGEAIELTEKMLSSDIIEIYSEAEFRMIRDYPGKHFILMNNISLTEEFYAEEFSGTLEGNGYSVSISGDILNEHGLFGTVTGTITDLALTDLDVAVTSSSTNYGVLTAVLDGGTLSGCTLDGALEVDASVTHVGGIAGYCSNAGLIEDCGSTLDMTVSDAGNVSMMAGICGMVESGSLSGCWYNADMNISANNKIFVGGIALYYDMIYNGKTTSSSDYAENCIVSGSITAVESGAGLYIYPLQHAKDSETSAEIRVEIQKGSCYLYCVYEGNGCTNSGSATVNSSGSSSRYTLDIVGLKYVEEGENSGDLYACGEGASVYVFGTLGCSDSLNSGSMTAISDSGEVVAAGCIDAEDSVTNSGAIYASSQSGQVGVVGVSGDGSNYVNNGTLTSYSGGGKMWGYAASGDYSTNYASLTMTYDGTGSKTNTAYGVDGYGSVNYGDITVTVLQGDSTANARGVVNASYAVNYGDVKAVSYFGLAQARGVMGSDHSINYGSVSAVNYLSEEYSGGSSTTGVAQAYGLYSCSDSINYGSVLSEAYRNTSRAYGYYSGTNCTSTGTVAAINYYFTYTISTDEEGNVYSEGAYGQAYAYNSTVTVVRNTTGTAEATDGETVYLWFFTGTCSSHLGMEACFVSGSGSASSTLGSCSDSSSCYHEIGCAQSVAEKEVDVGTAEPWSGS